jgi:hypothetical protein
VRRRPDLLDCTTYGVEQDRLTELLAAAREGRQQVLAAVCG